MLVMAHHGFFSFRLWDESVATGVDLIFRIAVASGFRRPACSRTVRVSVRDKVERVKESRYLFPLAVVGDPRRATHPHRIIDYTVNGRQMRQRT